MSSRTRRMRRLRKGGKVSSIVLRVLAVFAVLGLAVVALGVTLGAVYFDKALQGLPNVDDPNAFHVGQPTKLYSVDNHLLANFYLENREVVPMSAISTDLVHAIVATEDERYYLHGGYDPQGIARALVIDAMTMSTKEGASTITQQYVRNTILAKERYQNTLARKIREAYLADQLEKRFNKTQVLEKYLNTVYFGGGAYGAEAAAHEFFATTATKLTLAQAALLAGLPNSPVRLNPNYNLAGAKARQRWVLDKMVANKYITQAQADKADKEPLTIKSVVEPNQGIYACPYFVSYVRKLLLSKYQDSLIFSGGLKVYTTIDTRMQAAAEKAVRGTLGGRHDPDAALVAIDPATGYIKAMYGGKNYNASRFNTATQGRRQPGSSFKTFVLVTALEKGIPPNRPMDSTSPAVIPSHPPWHVSNSEGAGSGYMTITDATRNSVNCVFARLIWEVGPRDVARTAKRMGIQSTIPAFPSIALGSAPVTPLEMASAYGTLAAGGIHYEPSAWTKIVDSDGNVIADNTKPKGTRALSREIAWATTQQLMGVVESGTGTRASLNGREVAGKTGTAQNYQDAWFVGYTPQLVTAVWMGYLRGSVPMRDVHGERAFGGTFCAPIWHDFMAAALSRMAPRDFVRADSPHYIWKSEWNHAIGPPKPKVTPTKPVTPGGGGGGGVKPPPPPPPPPPTTSTPSP